MRSIQLTRGTTLAAAIAAALTAGLLVMQVSSAAFSDTTDNTGNFFVADQISLTDNDDDGAMFEIEGMSPGQVEVRCITVSYEGANDADVNLYAAIDGPDGDDGLAPALDITIDADTSPADLTVDGQFTCPDDFNGTATVQVATKLDAFLGDATDFDSGVGAIEFTDAQDVVYRFTVEFDDQVAGLDDYQGEAVRDLAFTWEARTN